MSTGADSDAAIQRLLSVRQYRGNGSRAPHKPLLILLALGRLSQQGTSQITWSEAERDLASLLNQFGRPSETKGASAVAYPFTRLRSDGFWTLSRDVPNDSVRALRQEPITGGLTPDLEAQLASSPEVLFDAAVRVAMQQFPVSMLGDVLQAVGLDGDPGVLRPMTIENVAVRKRRSSWRGEILQAWDNACAFCGYDGMAGVGPVGLEAAHVRWFNFGGPDDADNGLALCSLHHKLLDRGVLGFSEQDKVVVSEKFTARNEAGRKVYDLHGRTLRPRPGTALPNADHVAWHSEEVFLRPAIA